ncbi:MULTISPECIES: hypothetical protein [unclassified Butyrivibrio]|uniref:hypothetical protein n=1 Tax=unclassified Butyrivibrio TaxID=2639466 RepID=UPI00047EA0C9|nr:MULTISPECIES: hypothetical protein [unclassified Butyrivibrio]
MAAVLDIFLLPFMLLLRVAMYLIRRVDVTNSIFIGAIPVFLVRNQGYDKVTNWIIFGITVFFALLLQHMFVIAKILASVFSCMTIAFLCSIWKNYDTKAAQMTVVTIGTIIAAIWNLQYWTDFSEREV